MFELLVDLATPFLFVANIVVNEITLMNPELPLEEAYPAVGQWGPLVSAAFIILATVINKSIDMHQEKKKAREDVETNGTELETSPPKPAPSISSSPSASSTSPATDNQGSRSPGTPSSVHVETVTNIPKHS